MASTSEAHRESDASKDDQYFRTFASAYSKETFSQVVLSGCEEGEPCELFQKEPMSYENITIDIWGVANVHLLNHLLLTSYLACQDNEFYLAYMDNIVDLAKRYLRSSVLSFDMQYQEKQAIHGFQWGTFSVQLELKTSE